MRRSDDGIRNRAETSVQDQHEPIRRPEAAMQAGAVTHSLIPPLPQEAGVQF